jgi:hypothetical protein
LYICEKVSIEANPPLNEHKKDEILEQFLVIPQNHEPFVKMFESKERYASIIYTPRIKKIFFARTNITHSVVVIAWYVEGSVEDAKLRGLSNRYRL